MAAFGFQLHGWLMLLQCYVFHFEKQKTVHAVLSGLAVELQSSEKKMALEYPMILSHFNKIKRYTVYILPG